VNPILPTRQATSKLRHGERTLAALAAFDLDRCNQVAPRVDANRGETALGWEVAWAVGYVVD
jgi:hypothetical protein